MPLESTDACSPKSLAQKVVWFDLKNLDDQGNSPQLPADMAGFLKWPEGDADE